MNNLTPGKEFEISQPPADSISSVSFSPQANFLTATSWNNEVRIWEIYNNGSSVGKAMYQHEGPALCSVWSFDGTKVFSGGADKAGRMYDITTGQSSQVAQHSEPIKGIQYVQAGGSNQPMLVTGSWDKTLKYWDTRTPNPVATISLPDRCYSMDAKKNLMVVATAERHILVYDLNHPENAYQTIMSPLKWQTRNVCCFPDATGYTVSSIEGRVGIQYVQPANQAQSFTFKCHRDNNSLYPVNAICFHPEYGTFTTAGTDGRVNFWDKTSKQRLEALPKKDQPITCTAFNGNGSLFAYAESYDWYKGYTYAPPPNSSKIHIRMVKDNDVKPRPATKKR
ncbi:RNA export factor gle2 [Dispira simplex]|nr:RNA export factor gle2 [Dispira simplex]